MFERAASSCTGSLGVRFCQLEAAAAAVQHKFKKGWQRIIQRMQLCNSASYGPAQDLKWLREQWKADSLGDAEPGYPSERQEEHSEHFSKDNFGVN